jgi:hypothetical protein
MERGVWGIFQTAIMLAFFAVATQAQPVLVKEISSNSTDFTAVGDLVYYVAGDALFRTDGTATGTIFLKAGLHRQSTFTPFKDLLKTCYFLYRVPIFGATRKSGEVMELGRGRSS